MGGVQGEAKRTSRGASQHTTHVRSCGSCGVLVARAGIATATSAFASRGGGGAGGGGAAGVGGAGGDGGAGGEAAAAAASASRSCWSASGSGSRSSAYCLEARHAYGTRTWHTHMAYNVYTWKWHTAYAYDICSGCAVGIHCRVHYGTPIRTHYGMRYGMHRREDEARYHPRYRRLQRHGPGARAPVRRARPLPLLGPVR